VAKTDLASSLRARLPGFRERARSAVLAGRPGLDLGLASLNDLLGGAQGMGVVGGIAGARKTTLLQQLGWNTVRLEQAFFAHFSFEMAPEAIDSYSVAHLAGVEKCKALGPLFEEAAFAEQLAALEEAVAAFGARGHTFGLAHAKSVEQISQIVEDLRSRLKLERGLIAIDSLHALAAHVGRGARSERHAVDTVLNDLREIADSTNLAVVCTAQLTKRGAELDADFHFAQSAGADYTPDYTATLVTGKENVARPGAAARPLPATLHLHKNRFGREAVNVPLLYHPARTCFEEVVPSLEGDDDDA
jgi:hypothetical protein